MNSSAPFPVTTLQIPNPFPEGRNGVFVIHSDPLTIIDTGVATDRAQQELRQSLKAADIAVQDIGRIVLTHKHIDHIGNAWWLQEESGAEILIHEIEAGSISEVDPSGERWRRLILQRFSTWNVPSEMMSAAKKASDFAWDIQPARPTTMADGDRIDLGGADLEVIHTPGHTKGSVCLKLDRVLFSGDHILPKVSPNIGGGDLRHDGLLTSFMQSTQRCLELASEIDWVYPGHGEPFQHLHKRCQQLYDHHLRRLDQITGILRQRGPQNVYSMATAMFGRITNMHVVLGCAEAQAHLEYLVAEGRVVCDSDVYAAI